MNRFALTLMTVIALGCGGVIYARFTRPLLVVTALPERVTAMPDAPEPSPEFTTVAEQFLPHQPWAATAPYRHRDDNTFVYCHHYLLGNEQKSVSLRPFAVVLADGVVEGREQSPVTMIAESAQIDFSAKLTDKEFNVGRVVSGQLLGKVRIEGPDGLLIIGRNFFVSESSKRIWSDDIVLFRVGGHRGRGRGVEIRLATDDDHDAGLLAAERIRTVRIRESVLLELLAEGEVRTAETRPTDLIHVTSRGHLEFDLETNIASLERNVSVRRPTGGDLADTLKCDLLNIQLRRDGPDQESGTLRPVQLMAQGHVELQSMTNELLVTQVTNLTYMLEERVVELANTISLGGGDGPAMKIIQAGNEFLCRRLVLVHDEDHALQAAVCHGPGTFSSRGDDGPDHIIRAKWLQELRLEPDPATSLRVLQLAGAAVVEQPLEHTRLAAESIQLWFAQETAHGDSADQPAARNIRPVRLIARTDVVLESPQLSGPTSQLVVDFDAPGPAPAQSSAGTDTGVQSTTFSRSSSAASAREKFFVEADSIEARVQPGTGGQPTTVPELRLDGRVAVRSGDGPGPPDMSLQGDALHIVEDARQQQTMSLQGRPARVRRDDREIVGASIFLDRSGNHAEVEGSGSLRFAVRKDLEGNALADAEPLQIDWDKGMTFDGRVADLTGNVAARLGDGVTSRQELLCRQMKVHFLKPISFTDELTGGDEAELGEMLSHIECLGGVRINSHRFSQGRTTEERHASFRDLTIHQTSGNTRASGPGWITSWTPDAGGQPKLAPAVSARANASIQARKSDWNFTRIDFVGTLHGDYRRRLTTFETNVEIVYGPVDRLSQVIDPDTTADGEIPENAARLRCDRLDVTERGQLPDERTLELLGTGNAVLEGRTFHAEADEIKYDEHKEMFTLLARGERRARIWRRERVGAKWAPAEAQRFEFSPSRQKLNANGVTGVSGGE